MNKYINRLLPVAELIVIFLIAIVPVFASFPYRLNIFLSWEGAYRLMHGQLPYKDFGMPMGYMYWVIPALFFAIFGPYMITLVKAQAFINILSGLAFRSICKSLGVDPFIRFMSVLVFSLSYSFFVFWPWYNHTVIVFELIALAFLLRYMMNTGGRWPLLCVVLSGVFVFFSFFTKQDGGGLAFMLCVALLAYQGISEKKWTPLLVFVGSFMVAGLVLILPFIPYRFGYWFNHGQPPHTARISIRDILGEFLSGSQWIKFYLLVIAVLLFAMIRDWKTFLAQKRMMVFTLLTLGILAEAAIFQVTSYVPLDNNIFFHSFAFLFILSALTMLIPGSFHRTGFLGLGTLGVLLWWSPLYWKYVERFFLNKNDSQHGQTVYNGYTYSNVVNKNTYMIDMDTTGVPIDKWRVPQGFPTLRRVLVPGPTADGLERLKQLDIIKDASNRKILNMSELTSLAEDLHFSLERGSYYPLWFHKGVVMYDKETNMFVDRVKNKYYDLVLFEYIAYLNNFYPFAVRRALQENYKRIDVFPAPRKPSSYSWVEVYVRQ